MPTLEYQHSLNTFQISIYRNHTEDLHATYDGKSPVVLVADVFGTGTLSLTSNTTNRQQPHSLCLPLACPIPKSSSQKFQFTRTRQYCPRCLRDDSHPAPPYCFPSAHIPWLLERQIIIKRGLIATLPLQFTIPFTRTVFSDKDNDCDRCTPSIFLAQGQLLC